jgi:hypothetical protein
MTEQWRSVVGYEGLYEVSNLGRVRGVARRVWNKGGRAPHWQRVQGGVKTPWLGGPYPLIRLCKDGIKFTVPIYRLVAEAFLGSPPSAQYEVCHREGVIAGENVGNLYWGTRKENMADAVRHGSTRRAALKISKLSLADVAYIRAQRNGGMKLKLLAKQFNISIPNVSMIARGVTWK